MLNHRTNYGMRLELTQVLHEGGIPDAARARADELYRGLCSWTTSVNTVEKFLNDLEAGEVPDGHNN